MARPRKTQIDKEEHDRLVREVAKLKAHKIPNYIIARRLGVAGQTITNWVREAQSLGLLP